jgi:2-keto-3-deoxy-L-rhamnonate aldolase RhmA
VKVKVKDTREVDGVTTLANRLKSLLKENRVPIGTAIVSGRSPEIVYMAAASGFDFVWIDMQHSSATIQTVADLCVVARAAGITPIVRPDVLSFEVVHRLLDVGAQGIVFYDVRAPDQLQRYAEWMREPVSTPIARDYLPKQDYGQNSVNLTKMVTDSLAFIIQIESKQAVENIDELLDAALPDLVQIGRLDLSADLGVRDQIRHPLVLEAVDRIVSAASARGIVVEAGAYGREDIVELLSRGIRCFHYKTDTELLGEAYRQGVALLREITESASSLG